MPSSPRTRWRRPRRPSRRPGSIANRLGGARQIGRDLARRERATRTASKLRRLDSLRAELAGLADLPDVDAETLASWRDAHDEAIRVEKELADQRLDEAKPRR